MFPIDLDGLFPAIAGEKTERSLSIGERSFCITLTCSGVDKYDMLVTERDTNDEYLRRTALQEDVIQFNWRLFRENGFQKTIG
jgi:hypothetical protein